MAGGNFESLVGKKRPGTYVNFENQTKGFMGMAEAGSVLMPLPLMWGPVKAFTAIQAGKPDAQMNKLGFSVFSDDSNATMIREALKKAKEVIVYRLTGGNKAAATITNLTVTAKYEGSMGNSIKVVLEANPTGGFNFSLYLGSKLLLTQAGVALVSDLVSNAWVDFSGSGELSATAGVNLTGGTDMEVQNADITSFLDDSEVIKFNAMAFPYEDSSLRVALKAKMKHFRDGIGKKVVAVAPKFEADYEGIIGVDNSVILDDGKVLTVAEVCAYVAGLDSSAGSAKSNTYAKYDGAIDVHGKKTNEEAVSAIQKGLVFFSVTNDDVVLEYDVNTLTTFDDNKGESYRKNRVRRTLDAFDSVLQINFAPNKFDNSPDGWDLMESLGKEILLRFADARSISDVDLDNDFKVDREKSVGDETYIDVALKPVDSAEKIYFTVRTR